MTNNDVGKMPYDASVSPDRVFETDRPSLHVHTAYAAAKHFISGDSLKTTK